MTNKNIEILARAAVGILAVVLWVALLAAARKPLPDAAPVLQASQVVQPTPAPTPDDTPTLTPTPAPAVKPAAPALTTPASGAGDVARPVQLAWTAEGATAVEVQVATDAKFAKIVKTASLQATKGDISSLVLSSLGPETKYWWRVRASYEAGAGDWGQPATFTTNKDPLQPPALPLALAPKSGAGELDPTAVRLEWGTDRAEVCTVELSTDAGFAKATTLTATGKAVAAPALEHATTYYWRVKAKNAAGETGWSKTAKFSTKAETVVVVPPVGPARVVWEAEAAKGLAVLDAKQLETWKGLKLDKWPQDPAGRVSGTGKNVVAIRKVLPDEDKPHIEGPNITYTVNVPRKDIYYLWARTYWSTGCGNSVGVILPGGTATLVIGGDGTYNALHWLPLADGGQMDAPKALPLEAGPNVFTIVPREPGIKIDQFLITTDARLRPAGAYTPTKDGLAE